jgi:spermidine/putrescine transport system ATP-binding protein
VTNRTITWPEQPTAEPPSRGERDLELIGVTKRFGNFYAVNQMDLTVPQGSFFALLGPSGCGKTTTLRMIAGLEDPSAGSIRLGEDDITDLRPYKRPVNTVFQSYALFPHLTIFDNVAFGLRRRGVKDVKKQVDETLQLVELSGLESRKPAQLSGGQQQRVALARALINRPEVLLLDEPLGALDLKLRRQMQIELKRIQTEVGVTFVHVTHDQEEAMTMADTIAVMNAGVVEQLGEPSDLYENPSTTFVANFLGQSNLIQVKTEPASGGVVVANRAGQSLAVSEARNHSTGDSGWLGVRPEKIAIAASGSTTSAGRNVLTGGVVSDVSFIGVSTQYLVKMPWDQELTIFEQNTGRIDAPRVGDHVDLIWNPEHCFLLDSAQDAHAGQGSEDDE